MSLFISTAYSIGSSLTSGSMNPADDHGRGFGLGEAAAPEVEELLLADLRDAGLVADLDVVLVDLDVRVRVGPALRVEDQGVADDVRLRPLGPEATFKRPR